MSWRLQCWAFRRQCLSLLQSALPPLLPHVVPSICPVPLLSPQVSVCGPWRETAWLLPPCRLLFISSVGLGGVWLCFYVQVHLFKFLTLEPCLGMKGVHDSSVFLKLSLYFNYNWYSHFWYPLELLKNLSFQTHGQCFLVWAVRYVDGVFGKPVNVVPCPNEQSQTSKCETLLWLSDESQRIHLST